MKVKSSEFRSFRETSNGVEECWACSNPAGPVRNNQAPGLPADGKSATSRSLPPPESYTANGAGNTRAMKDTCFPTGFTCQRNAGNGGCRDQRYADMVTPERYQLDIGRTKVIPVL